MKLEDDPDVPPKVIQSTNRGVGPYTQTVQDILLQLNRIQDVILRLDRIDLRLDKLDSVIRGLPALPDAQNERSSLLGGN